MILSRRSFLVGIGSAAIVAPALMKFDLIKPRFGLVKAELWEEYVVTSQQASQLTLQMITREVVKLWKNSNQFLQSIDLQYQETDILNTISKHGPLSKKYPIRINLPAGFKYRA